MEEKELKNENNTTVTLDSLEISKREDEDITLATQNNGDKEIQGVKSISLGKSLLGDNTLKKGISVSVRGRNAGSVLNLKNGGSVWMKKDEKGLENQQEIGKKIDEESFPDLLESTEKIKSEFSKDKDKKKKGGKELKKQEDGSFRYGSEKGKGESVSGDKRRPFTNNLETSQNNDSGLKKWSDQVNENEATDVKENEHAADEKQDAENMGYLMPGFKGKHMIGFYCFLKKGSQNPPPLPPKVPFDDTSFFEIIEKQKNLMTKPVVAPVISASQQMAQLGQGNQMSQVMQTSPAANVQSTNCVNNGNMGIVGGSNQNQMNQVNKINTFNPNDKVMRKQQDVGQNRFMQNPQVASLSRSNLNMFDENANNISGNNSNVNVSRSNNYQQRGARNIGQNNMNYGMNNTNDMMKNVLNSANNYIKGSSNAGSPSMGGNVRQRNFNRRNEKKDDKKVKIADIDADTNWRSPLNKKVDDEKTAEVSNDMWNGSMDNNATNMNYNNDNNSTSNNNNKMYNNNNNNTAGNDRMKRGFRNRNANPVGNVSSVGSASSFNRNNFNSNRNFFSRNSTNSNVMNRNNLHKNNNMNSGNNSFINNNNVQMNVSRNNMYRGNGNRNNASTVNNSNYTNYGNMGNNKNMNRNFVKRNNVGNVQNFGNNDGGNNGGVLANNLFNRLSGNMFQNTSFTQPAAAHTSPSNRRAANIEQDNSANMSGGTAITDRGNDLNVEIGNN